MEINYRVIAEVIKHWRSNAEERALASAILYLLDINHDDALRLTVPELKLLLETRASFFKVERNCCAYSDTDAGPDSNCNDSKDSIEIQNIPLINELVTDSNDINTESEINHEPDEPVQEPVKQKLIPPRIQKLKERQARKKLT